MNDCRVRNVDRLSTLWNPSVHDQINNWSKAPSHGVSQAALLAAGSDMQIIPNKTLTNLPPHQRLCHSLLYPATSDTLAADLVLVWKEDKLGGTIAKSIPTEINRHGGGHRPFDTTGMPALPEMALNCCEKSKMTWNYHWAQLSSLDLSTRGQSCTRYNPYVRWSQPSLFWAFSGPTRTLHDIFQRHTAPLHQTSGWIDRTATNYPRSMHGFSLKNGGTVLSLAGYSVPLMSPDMQPSGVSTIYFTARTSCTKLNVNRRLWVSINSVLSPIDMDFVKFVMSLMLKRWFCN